MPSSERYNYLYTEKELDPWAARIRRVSGNGESIFVITNNHFEGKGVVNALQLIHLLTQAKVKVPEPLRQRLSGAGSHRHRAPGRALLFPTR